jgi:hypothetical protein
LVKRIEIAKERIADLRSILEDALAGGGTLEGKTFDDLNKLEAKIMADVDKKIFIARCAAITTLNGTAQEAIAKALAHIGESDPTVTFIGIPLFHLRFRKVDIDHPDEVSRITYFDVLASTPIDGQRA